MAAREEAPTTEQLRVVRAASVSEGPRAATGLLMASPQAAAAAAQPAAGQVEPEETPGPGLSAARVARGEPAEAPTDKTVGLGFPALPTGPAVAVAAALTAMARGRQL